MFAFLALSLFSSANPRPFRFVSFLSLRQQEKKNHRKRGPKTRSTLSSCQVRPNCDTHALALCPSLHLFLRLNAHQSTFDTPRTPNNLHKVLQSQWGTLCQCVSLNRPFSICLFFFAPSVLVGCLERSRDEDSSDLRLLEDLMVVLLGYLYLAGQEWNGWRWACVHKGRGRMAVYRYLHLVGWFQMNRLCMSGLVLFFHYSKGLRVGSIVVPTPTT